MYAKYTTLDKYAELTIATVALKALLLSLCTSSLPSVGCSPTLAEIYSFHETLLSGGGVSDNLRTGYENKCKKLQV